MKFGIQLHQDRGVDAVLAEARLADTQGFDSVWLFDHLMGFRPGATHVPNEPLETFTLMTAVGAVTERVRLAFATLNLSFRHPPVLAKMLATLDQITHGRVICSIGAGWFEDECNAYGLPFVADHDERMSASGRSRCSSNSSGRIPRRSAPHSKASSCRCATCRSIPRRSSVPTRPSGWVATRKPRSRSPRSSPTAGSCCGAARREILQGVRPRQTGRAGR